MRSMKSVKKAVNCCCEKGRILIKHGRKQQAGSDISVIMIRKRKPDGLVSVFCLIKFPERRQVLKLDRKTAEKELERAGRMNPGK